MFHYFQFTYFLIYFSGSQFLSFQFILMQECSPSMLIVLITPPPIDEEGRLEDAVYNTYCLLFSDSFFLEVATSTHLLMNESIWVVFHILQNCLLNQ